MNCTTFSIKIVTENQITKFMKDMHLFNIELVIYLAIMYSKNIKITVITTNITALTKKFNIELLN